MIINYDGHFSTEFKQLETVDIGLLYLFAITHLATASITHFGNVTRGTGHSTNMSGRSNFTAMALKRSVIIIIVKN